MTAWSPSTCRNRVANEGHIKGLFLLIPRKNSTTPGDMVLRGVYRVFPQPIVDNPVKDM